LTVSAEQFRTLARGNLSLLFTMAFVALVIGGAYLGSNLSLAIYSLSFWHYYLYWLAYVFGAVSLGVFKRDAIVMKTVSLIALAVAYLAAPPDLLSLTIVASGFLLNVIAARALGSDRTYYGHEVADLPRRQVAVFPYSWISHPMLVGNVAAFGGTLINADFRQQWWPLAGAHVAMNLGLLVMELAVRPQRRGGRRACSMQTGCCIVTAGAVLGGAVGSWRTWGPQTLLAAALGAGAFAYAYVMYCCYTSPSFPRNERREAQAEGSS